MGSPSWESESPAAEIFARFDTAKWVSALGTGYRPVKMNLRAGLTGVVWLGSRSTTTSQVAQAPSGQGVGLKGGSPVLQVREEMFTLEMVLTLFPVMGWEHIPLGSHSLVLFPSSFSLFLHFVAPLPTLWGPEQGVTGEIRGECQEGRGLMSVPSS